MVIPYQIWMLQRLESVLGRATATTKGEKTVRELLSGFARGEELLELSSRLDGCRVRKEGALLYSCT